MQRMYMEIINIYFFMEIYHLLPHVYQLSYSVLNLTLIKNEWNFAQWPIQNWVATYGT